MKYFCYLLLVGLMLGACGEKEMESVEPKKEDSFQSTLRLTDPPTMELIGKWNGKFGGESACPTPPDNCYGYPSNPSTVSIRDIFQAGAGSVETYFAEGEGETDFPDLSADMVNALANGSFTMETVHTDIFLIKPTVAGLADWVAQF